MSVLVTRERFSYESLAGHLKVRRVYRHETNRDLDGEGVEKWIMQALGLHQLHRQANGEVRPHISEDNRVTAGYLAALEMVIDLRLY